MQDRIKERLYDKSPFDVDIHDPRKIEENRQVIGDDALENMLLVISNGEDAIKKLQKYVKLGFTGIVLHSQEILNVKYSHMFSQNQKSNVYEVYESPLRMGHER